jgi:hypothetical protein
LSAPSPGDGDFGPAPGTGLEWPPFRTFGEQFYTYQILLDLKVEEGLATRIEPHPRFYADPTDSVPIAVPALVRRWWPTVNFVVFKSPAEGRTHIFRPGEPFAQVIVIPADSEFEIVEMNEEEAAERELQSRRIHASRDTLSADTPGAQKPAIRFFSERVRTSPASFISKNEGMAETVAGIRGLHQDCGYLNI